MSPSTSEFRSSLIGAWSLTSYRAEPLPGQPGDILYPMTKDASGIIMYTPDGYMSAQLMTPGCPLFKDGDLSGGTQEELAAVGRNYLAYSGPFVVKEDENGRPVLNHSMEVSSFPNWLGNTQVRVAKLEGDRLTLSTEGPIVINGKLMNPILEWKKKQLQPSRL
ncbi:hypothetical protein BJ508DRAFT_307358 [Ascobolus immersus RN42]|uniref:Lipocalin-like domain-containing protein n=1 Tax=Ascobolus immersus RN42 TaxID=1160509 RepID=A0A3N4IFU8_ASCIM|nr:hypothetical protein BJ508DRAFT_307358 [Ascobolus immersus RN42]